MSNINRNILNAIDSYKNVIFTNCNNLLSIILNYPQCDLTDQLETINKLFYIITENIRIDLNYLAFLDPTNDVIGFPALKRNLRSSIEAFYDLYNLSKSSDYLALLKYNSTFINEQVIVPKKYKELKISKTPFYTLKDKANIALNLNGYTNNNFNIYKDIASNGNAYVHNDTFITPPDNKALALATMLRTDCCIICESYICVSDFLKRSFSVPDQYNPCNDFNLLIDKLARMGSIII